MASVTLPPSEPVLVGQASGRSSRSLEDLMAGIRSSGMRITANRRAILSVLLAARSPLSLGEIREGALRYGGKPDFSTVFRTIQQLESIKMVARVNLGMPFSFFELSDPRGHHEHLICEKCGAVISISDVCPAADMECKLGAKYGFTELRHTLEFFGRCLQEKDNCTINGTAQKRRKAVARLIPAPTDSSLGNSPSA